MPTLVSMVALSLLTLALGCGLEAGPQPPSLQLPKTISDLTAERTGNQVSLQWNTPKETTDKLKLREQVHLHICRLSNASGCDTVATIFAAPGKPAQYTDVLPGELAAGPLRTIHYEIFGINKHGRSAGPSNAAPVLAGSASPMVLSLSATEVERGVVLHWQPVASLQNGTSIQLQRTLLTPAAETRKRDSSGLRPIAEPIEQTLRIALGPGNKDPGRAIDESVAFNRKYRYSVTRVTTLQVENRTLQLASATSMPVTIATRDTFPPAAPTGLAAVPVSAAINGGTLEVDLSWSANTEPDVAQYLIYRRILGETKSGSNSTSQQIAPENPEEPILAAAFRDLHVQAGFTYGYTVVAVDSAGNKSQPSAEVMAKVSAS